MRISDWSSDVCSSDLRLFRETVLGRLTDRDPARPAELHRRASRYFAETGDLLEAIEHAHLSRDQAFLAGQLESLSEDIIYSAFSTGWMSWARLCRGNFFHDIPCCCLRVPEIGRAHV